MTWDTFVNVLLDILTTQTGLFHVHYKLAVMWGIGLFFISPWIMINNGYGGRPFKLTLIDGGYATLGCAAIGLVLGLF